MPLSKQELKSIIGKLMIGEAYHALKGPSNLHDASRQLLNTTHKNRLNDCLTECIMFATLAAAHADPTVLAQAVVIQGLINCTDEQTSAHVVALCEDAMKFWLENKDSESLMKELQQFGL